MKLGIDSYSTRNSGLDAVGVLGYAAEQGLAGVLFELSPFSSFRDDALARIRGFAEEKRLFIELGMGSIHCWHPMAEKGRQLLADAGYDMNVSDAQIVIRHLEIARKLGSKVLRCVVGNLLLRDEGHDMSAVADQTVGVLREACLAAEQMGMQIAMENHADFTVREMASIYARVNSPAFGFTLDTANVAFDLDSPIRLAEILAPHVITTHFKNYRILRTPDGLALENCGLGEGEIDVVAMAELLARQDHPIPLNIEIHSQHSPFRLDILNPSFWTRHRSPPGDGLAWYLERCWNKPVLSRLPASLADGAAAWQLESKHIQESIAWARSALGHLLD